ncbi:MAG: peptide chain release factor N(5)-glutamine methyltransferase [Gammaproteobacteria bacterium]
MTLREAIEFACTKLTLISDSAKLDAQLLLCKACKFEPTTIFAHPEQKLSDQELGRFTNDLDRRSKGEPLAYIIGTKEFWSLEIMVNPHVLIPRPDTELLVELTLKSLSHIESPYILELGTGSGAVAIALAKERSDCTIFATDISLPAITLAKQNARKHQANITFIHSDWYKNLPDDKYHAIISNPPYIDTNDMDLDKFVSEFEPKQALISENNGLHALSEIISTAPSMLKKNGSLIVEHGFQQASSVSELFINANINNINMHKDLAGNPRCTMGYL